MFISCFQLAADLCCENFSHDITAAAPVTSVMKCMVLLTWHYSDSTPFINLCFAGALLACPSPKVRSDARNRKAHHKFLMAISMHSDPLSPSAPRITARSRVFINARVIGVIEHSADSRLFLFLYRCQAWVGGVFHYYCGTVGPCVSSFNHGLRRQQHRLSWPTFFHSQSHFFLFCFASFCIFPYLDLCHFRSGNRPDI